MTTFQKKADANLKTLFHSQLQKSDNVSTKANPPLNDSSVTTCCANNLETFSIRQTNVVGKFVEVVYNTQSQNMNTISTD